MEDPLRALKLAPSGMGVPELVKMRESVTPDGQCAFGCFMPPWHNCFDFRLLKASSNQQVFADICTGSVPRFLVGLWDTFHPLKLQIAKQNQKCMYVQYLFNRTNPK